MRQRNKHLPPALSDTADVVLHNGDLARKAVLITQPLEYPLRCVTLLLRTILILFQDTVDNTDERIELRADRRPRPDITRWRRIAQHLPDRARVDPKTTNRFALAQTLNHYRVANPPIQFHSLHPPPFAPKCKGLSLTEFAPAQPDSPAASVRDYCSGVLTPWCDTDAMAAHLIEISAAVDPGAHAVLIVDQAGWHLTPKLAIPDNITVLALPPRSPELNPVENVWHSCATTGCRTGSSNPTKTSSRCAAKPGTTSSTNHGRSCPSACANGRMGSDQ